MSEVLQLSSHLEFQQRQEQQQLYTSVCHTALISVSVVSFAR